MRESADAFESRPSSTSKRARRAIIVGGKQRHPSRKRRVGPPTSDTTAGAQRLARFPTCLPRGTAGVDVTPTRIQTSRSDVQQPAATPNPQPARLALFSGLLVHYFGTPVSSSWRTLVALPGFIQYSWFVSPRLCHRRFRKPVAGPIFSPAPATPPHPCPALCQVPLVSPAILPSSFSPSCVGRPVRAGPVFGPAGPTAGRSPHVAGPACGGCDRRDLTRRRRRPPCVTRPTSRTVENALRTGVFGCACAYGRKRALPSTGPSAGGVGSYPRGGRGPPVPPAGPPTPTYPT